MSREAVWKQFGYVVGSARNPEFDRTKGTSNSKCEKCNHIHGLGSICRIKMTKHDKEENTFSYYKCACNG